MSLKLAIPIKILMIALVLSLGFTIFNTSKVHACPSQPPSPGYLPCDIGSQLQAYDYNAGQPPQNCYSNPSYNPAVTRWLSPTGDPESDSTINVVYGQSSISMQLNLLDYECQRYVSPAGTFYPNDGSPTDASLTSTNTSVDAAQLVSGSASNFSGPVGAVITQNYNPNTRYWYASQAGFTLNAPAGGFTTNETVTVRVYITPINVFHGNDPLCVATGGQAASPNPPSNCPATPTDFTFNINVPPPVESNIFSVDANGGNYHMVAGALVISCANNIFGAYNTTTGTANSYYYFGIPPGDGFCLRIINTPFDSTTNSIPGFDGPFVRPNDPARGALNGYPGFVGNTGLPACGPFTNADPLNKTCTETSYECQVASSFAFFDACDFASHDRASDDGNDFTYIGFCGPTTTACQPGQQPTEPSCTLSNSSVPQPGVPFNMKATITNNAKVATLHFGPGLYNIKFTTNPLGLTFPTPSNVAPGTTETINIPVMGIGSGQYDTTATLSWPAAQGLPGGSVNCTDPIKTADEPYLKVYGGDVMAGSAFASSNVSAADPDSCSGLAPSPSAISSWDDTHTGAATDAAAFATLPIYSFGSAGNMAVPGGHGAEDGLTFANMADPFGGSFGTAFCVPDYYTSLNMNASSSVNVLRPTGPSIKLSTTLPSSVISSPTVILVDNQNITIDENTTFPVGGVSANSNPATLPMLYVVDKGGSIYIKGGASGVTKLAGAYIAEPTATAGSGTIYDCATLNSSGIGTGHDSDPANDCKLALTVSGSFIAGSIDFERSNGSQEQSTNGGNCSNPDQNAADVFCYSALTWLANPYSSTNSGTFDYISAVPPTL